MASDCRGSVLFVAVGFALYFLTYRWCREVVVRVQPRVTVRETVRTLRTNKPLGILCGSSFFYLIGLFAVGGATAYYAIYVLGDARYIIWMTLVTVVVQFATAPFIPRLVARVGKKNLYAREQALLDAPVITRVPVPATA